MADQDGTKQVTNINSDVAERRAIEEDKRWNREMRLKACDEVIEDAIDMLSFLAADWDAESMLVARAVAVQSEAVVRTLRNAQKHLRKGLVD